MGAYGNSEQMEKHALQVREINEQLYAIEQAYKCIERLALETGLMVSYRGPACKGDSGTLYPPGTYDWNDRFYYGNVKRDPDLNDEPLWMPSSQEGC
ncbi:hypothetical protein CPT_Mendera_093 [Stenotrophomonas phage Mendera]|uniref:Uncharacterized protein n=1 Tax=Stenotrophomonas phage Mendera TaxID=2650877 RepID=A0A5P8PIS9_9CAUD|nr:hypothetical protein HWC60_gp093 [Stenotrophomonas phage Mendera]QFR56642.1 hypothetical protein CPT_Mendera_093 [Stenotrophomonas phage Mendera]